MSEKYTVDRAIFPEGEQKKFLLAVKNNSGDSWQNLAAMLGVHSRTLREWTREKYRMPYSFVETLAKKSSLGLPQNLKILTWKEHLARAGSAGGMALVKKHHGRVAKDENFRKKKWLEWWKQVGQYQQHRIKNIPLPINRVKKSEQLAEFVGIVLGDGGISNYQVAITLHRFDDIEYSKFVQKLIRDLFGVTAKKQLQKDALADDFVVSRIKLVNLLVHDLGLKKGSKVKQQVDIPTWIKTNRKFYRACVRGLIDTDGCVFTHRYKVKGREYKYKKLSFTNRSEPLLQSVLHFLVKEGFAARLGKHSDVRLDSTRDMERYFQVVGSHNPKHLRRYKQ